MDISKFRIKIIEDFLTFQELKNSTKALKIFMIILFKKLPVLILIAFGFSKNSLLSFKAELSAERKTKE